ncbi:MAG: diaminopimelate epimerase, partial [Arenimonas sp.]|nr:diaminopimelate epimerase [Arenimonas sp.]
MAIRFSKMHGAGNDFVLVDLRGGQPRPDAAIARAIGNRHTGVGFDQLLTIEASELPACVARYRIWNSDGSQAQQCGNGARCVAAWLVRDGAASPPGFKMESPAGVIEVECLADGRFALDMGLPEFTPSAIPFNVAAERVQYEVVLDGNPIRFGAVSMGNPHAVIVVDAVAQAPVALIGPMLQSAGDFPESVNVGFAQIVSPAEIDLRVFERGAGETLACGSGACAAIAVLVRQGRVGRHVD